MCENGCRMSPPKKSHHLAGWLKEFKSLLTALPPKDNKAASLYIFPLPYQDSVKPEEALGDAQILDHLDQNHPVEIRFFPRDSEGLRLKVYRLHEPLPLFELVPLMKNLGISLVSETSHNINHKRNKTYWVHDCLCGPISFPSFPEEALRRAFIKIWAGEIEDDSLGGLTLKAGISPEDIVILRGYSRYLAQVKGHTFEMVSGALLQNPTFSFLLVQLFHHRFDPGLGMSPSQREEEWKIDILEEALKDVVSAGEDELLRALWQSIQSTVRTTFYQRSSKLRRFPKPVAFKIDFVRLGGALKLPLGSLYETFIYAPHFEAIHLRGGKIARGGIRWSERPQDFREEVLGLMKTQILKNTVIVPTGAKGGFVVRAGSSKGPAASGKECYQDMMRSLLSLTDNLKISSTRPLPPRDVLCYDGVDPYMVVAADKGTATFSDLANSIAEEFNFWLGDAFASGGSHGYDHKKMGITSRGTWKSVERHLQDLGYSEERPLTVVGVGDMSGDVFGNGLIYLPPIPSPYVKLLAAFNHQCIFLDPNPDPEQSFHERNRLFKKENSSWKDYDISKISQGGGVFDRSVKKIPLSLEIKEVLGMVEADASVAPEVLIKALLKAPVDLLWLGGIGTFIKSSTQRDAEVGDLGNRLVRVDASHVRARIIAEGANLGMTAEARVEFALKGGKVNGDFIDNAGGVDCSDHEVNIKILCALLEKQGISLERDVLIKVMTEEVEALVLQDNYLQNFILSFMEKESKAQGVSYSQVLSSFQREVTLEEAEALPKEGDLKKRIPLGKGWVRPELALLLSYAKIVLKRQLESSSLLKDGLFEEQLLSYFPRSLQLKFPEQIAKHPLRRALKGTVIANNFLNTVGPLFLAEVQLVTGASLEEIVTVFYALKEALGGMTEAFQGRTDGQHDDQMGTYGQLVETLKILVCRSVGRGHKVLTKIVDAVREGDFFQSFPQEVGRRKEFLWALPYRIESFLGEESGATSFMARDVEEVFGLQELYAMTAALPSDGLWQRALSLQLLGKLLDLRRLLAGKCLAAQISAAELRARFLKSAPDLATPQPSLSWISFCVAQYSRD